MQHLQSGALLKRGDYKILQLLGQGGFGVTYLAIQSGLERKVAVKEFFMKELCGRDENTSLVSVGTEGSRETVERFREKFLKEARNLARLKHPNIVSVIDVFEENGTAYYVMEFAERGSLADKVKREGYLTEPVATRYILQVADALRYVHQRKMNHLDVKPANIMLNENDEAVLIDFGLAKQYDSTGSQTSSTPVGISEGYAPMEQYKQGGVGAFSPETDIYALGATYFKLLTGQTPPSASDIFEDGVPVDVLQAKGVSHAAISAICKAMEGKKKDRMSNVDELVMLLETTLVGAGELPQSIELEKTQVNVQTDEATIAPKVIAHDTTIQNTHIDEPCNEVIKDKSLLVYKKYIILGVTVLAIVGITIVLFVKNGASTYHSVLEKDIANGNEIYGGSDTNMPDSSTSVELDISKTLNEPQLSSNDDVYDIAEQQPEFPGGTTALMQYLSSHIKYPVVAQENGVEGRVLIKFIVERDGSITNITVEKGVDPLLDKEAIRVIKSMPKWKPGMVNENTVRVYFIIPITYKLE